MRRRLLLTALAAAAIAVPAAQAASPQAAFGLRAVGGSAQAGYFVFTTAAGTTRTGTVVVSNSGGGTGTVRLYTADGGTGTTTGTIYLTDDQPKDTGSWIVLGKTSLTLAPGKSARVPFTVKVPAGTPVGQHVGGIVAEATGQHAGTGGKGKTSVRIKIRNQSIMAVQVNVPGTAIHKFTIGKVTTGGANGFQQVVFRVSNEGNVLERPTGSIAISSGGKLVQTLKFTMDTFLPQTSIDYPIELKKALPAGTYSAAVTLHYALGSPTGTRTAAERPKFTVTPQDVQKVFTSATPTLAAPTTPAPTSTTATTTAPTASSSSGTSPIVYVVAAAVAALLLLLLVYLLARRRRGPAAMVTIPAPAPRSPAAVPPLPSAAPAPAVPEPAPAAPEPAPEPAPQEPGSGGDADNDDEASPAAAPAAPAPEAAELTPTTPACDPFHYWEVDYETGVHGRDGVWRFPHRCKSCGLEVLARDVTDASQQASARQ